MKDWLMYQVAENGWTLENVCDYAGRTIEDLRQQVTKLKAERPDPNRIFEESERALVNALELGFKAGMRGYVLQRGES